MPDMPKRDTMNDAGYRYISYVSKLGGHVLERIDDGQRELWAANNGHASYGITWRNTDLEFVTSVGRAGYPQDKK